MTWLAYGQNMMLDCPPGSFVSSGGHALWFEVVNGYLIMVSMKISYSELFIGFLLFFIGMVICGVCYACFDDLSTREATD